MAIPSSGVGVTGGAYFRAQHMLSISHLVCFPPGSSLHHIARESQRIKTAAKVGGRERILLSWTKSSVSSGISEPKQRNYFVFIPFTMGIIIKKANILTQAKLQ